MVLPVEYSDLVILVLALFAFMGLMRGWYREGITSIFVGILALLVWKPEAARRVVDTLNKAIKLVFMFFKSGLSLDPGRLTAQKVDPGVLLDPYSYRLYITITVFLIVISYIIGDATFKGKMTPLGRLLGGVLGLANGYVVLSLIKQYFMNYMQAPGRVGAQGAPLTGQMAIRVQNVPAESFIAGYGIVFVFVVLAAVVALLIAGDRLKLPLK